MSNKKMPDREIHVTIKARAGVGKTTVAHVINNNLRKLGFKSILIDPDAVPPEAVLNKQRVKSIATGPNRPTVIIKTIQAPRNIIVKKKRRNEHE